MAATLLRSGTYSGCFTSRITTVRRIQAVSLAPRVNTIQPCVIPSCSFLGGEQSVVVYLILITILGAEIGVRHSVVEAAMQTAFAWLTALQALPHVEQFRISDKSECSCISQAVWRSFTFFVACCAGHISSPLFRFNPARGRGALVVVANAKKSLGCTKQGTRRYDNQLA